MNNRTESRSSQRSRLIGYLYQELLIEGNIASLTAFESGNFSSQEVKIFDHISANQQAYFNLIKSFLSAKWTLDRLDPLELAILLYGAFELAIKPNMLKSTINELIIYTKSYVPGDSYKFINAILDKIGVHYATQRS